MKPAASCTPLPAAATVCRRGSRQKGCGKQGQRPSCLPAKGASVMKPCRWGVKGQGPWAPQVMHAPSVCQVQSVQKRKGAA